MLGSFIVDVFHLFFGTLFTGCLTNIAQTGYQICVNNQNEIMYSVPAPIEAHLELSYFITPRNKTKEKEKQKKRKISIF